MVAQGREHCGDCRPSFGVYDSASRWIGDGAGLSSHNLLASNHQPRCPNCPLVPSAGSICRNGSARPVEYGHALNRSDIAPATRSESRHVLGILRPVSDRLRPDDIGFPWKWRRRRVVAPDLFNCTGDDEVEKLERFIVPSDFLFE